MAYKRLLVAIDLGAASDKIAIKAATMARNQQAEIHILHIVEPLSLTYGADLHLDTSALQEDINEQAEVHLSNLAENLNIPKQHCHLASGRPKRDSRRGKGDRRRPNSFRQSWPMGFGTAVGYHDRWGCKRRRL